MPEDEKPPEPTASEPKAAYEARSGADWKKKHPKGSFWNPLTLDELIEQQGTKPMTEADFVRPDFFEDEDIDEFVRAATSARYRRDD